MSRYCTACGVKSDGNDRFCAGCGASLPGLSAMPPSAVASSGAPQPVVLAPVTPSRLHAPQAAPSPADAAVAAAATARAPTRRALRIALCVVGALFAAFVGLAILAPIFGDREVKSSAGSPAGGPAWSLTSGEGQNLYAVGTPAKATLNLKAVVLSCEISSGMRVLNLHLYPIMQGPLLPNGASREQIKDEPRVRLQVDGAVVPADIYFAGEFAVVANQVAGGRPVITPPLAATLERGKEMILQFDLLRDQPGATPFDALAVITLNSANGAASIGAVRRRCGQ